MGYNATAEGEKWDRLHKEMEEGLHFTEDHLIEIEKVFDVLAGNVCKSNAEILMAFSKIEGSEELTSKLFHEAVNTFTMYREISAICMALRKKEKYTFGFDPGVPGGDKTLVKNNENRP